MINSLASIPNAVANIALVTPLLNTGYQPISPVNGSAIGSALFFHGELDNDWELEGELTRNYLGDNSYVQDHFVMHPPLIRVRGVVGEVTVLAPQTNPLSPSAANVLSIVSDFAPGFSSSAQAIINQTNEAYQQLSMASNKAVQAVQSISSIGNLLQQAGQIAGAVTQGQQQAFFSAIYGYMLQQASVSNPLWWSVSTPWATATPCVLTSCKPHQSQESNMISEFMLTFELIRVVNDGQTQLISLGRAANYSSVPINNGVSVTSQGPSMSSSLPELN
jgi:hypothetical protein